MLQSNRCDSLQGGQVRSRTKRTAKFTATLAVALLAGCSHGPAQPERIVSVQTGVAQRSTIRRIVTAEAVLYPLKEAALTPKISAPVKQFFVNRGSRVHRGQLLATLENRDLAAAEVENKGAYEQAEANYKSTTAAQVPEEMQKAELDVQQAKEALDAQQKLYDSRENLYKQGALPRKDLDQAAVALVQARGQYEIASRHLAALRAVGKEQQLKAAEGQLTAAQGKYMGAAAQLAYSEIRSPIDGVVTDRPLFPGEMAPAGTPLITVMDLSKVVARAHIPQEEAALLKPGDSATISGPGITEEVPGKVMLISPALDPNSTTLEVWVEAANRADRLRPGSTVRVSVVAKVVPDAIVVPASSLLTDSEGKTSVMTVAPGDRAHQQPVQIGIRENGEVEITNGLAAGQQVITAGAYGLPEGTKVKIENVGAPPASEGGTAEKKD